MSLYSISNKYLPYLGVALVFLAFLAWNPLISIDKRLFDITWNLGIVLFLYYHTDAPAIALSTLLAWRLYDEVSGDNGIVDWFDICVEIPVILTVTLVKVYIIKFGREELKGLLYSIISKIKKV